MSFKKKLEDGGYCCLCCANRNLFFFTRQFSFLDNVVCRKNIRAV